MADSGSPPPKDKFSPPSCSWVLQSPLLCFREPLPDPPLHCVAQHGM